ncbi:unknown [Prevotella sp. CAG:1124]|nr:unknown [Prevotella sp. CAG:1124]
MVYQPFVSPELRYITFSSSKWPVNHLYNVVRLVCFGVESVVRVRPFKGDCSFGVVLVIVLELPHLRLGYRGKRSPAFGWTFTVDPDNRIRIVVTYETSQCIMGGKHEHITIEKGQLAFPFRNSYINRSMRRTISLQYITYLVLVLSDKITKLFLTPRSCPDNEPMEIHTVEFVFRHTLIQWS